MKWLRRLKPARQINRSFAGSLALFMVLALVGAFMIMPIVLMVMNAFKPLDELFYFPPRFFVRNPTLRNFTTLFTLMSESWVPFSRYVFNTLFITGVGIFGHVILASAAAYPLAKHKVPGKAFIFSIIVLSLMFAREVTAVPNYMIITALGVNNTYWAVIMPAFAMSLGLYLMKQFMEQIPDSLIESARIDGANEYVTWWKIVMPNVRPAWLTLTILMFQALWGETGGQFLRDEAIKPLSFAMQQIAMGGVARQGAFSAVSLLMFVVPVAFFIFTQSHIIETMATSGMKE
ncbi:MAG: carbohydrate ABC transporter permease [Defluviitaleaceae bacterium]|nr:carbohydrate ABC transporter permease [Defluviitaleaceae bacterium]